VGANAEVEPFFAGNLDEVPENRLSVRMTLRGKSRRNRVDILVGADTGGFEGFRRELLILVGDHVDAERELIDVGTLAAKIEDADFGVGNTTVEARFGVRLKRDGKSVCCTLTSRSSRGCPREQWLMFSDVIVPSQEVQR